MMTRMAALVLLSLLLVLSVGCSFPMHYAPVRPPTGVLISNYKAPLTTDFSDTPVDCPKQGRSATSYLHLNLIFLQLQLAWGDATIDSAAKKGQIRNVAYAEYEFFNVLGIYSQFTTIAHGS